MLLCSTNTKYLYHMQKKFMDNFRIRGFVPSQIGYKVCLASEDGGSNPSYTSSSG